MAVNPLISLQGSNVVPEFKNVLTNLGEIQRQEQFAAEAPARQKLLEAQADIATKQVPSDIQKFTEQDRIFASSVADISRQIIPDLESGNIEIAIQKMQDRSAKLKAAGMDTSNTDKAIQLAQQNPQELLRASVNAVAVDDRLRGKGKTVKSVFKEGELPGGGRGLFSVTPEGATQVPGITPVTRTPLVQIGGKGAEAEQKELAKLRAQDLKALRAKGSEAEQQILSLDILDNINVATGSAEPMKQAIATFAEGFGVDASGLADIASGQIFTAEAGKTVLRVMSTQKGPQTDRDADRIAKTLARLGNRPEANGFINDSARAVANRALDQRDFHDAWLDKNDTLKGAASSWNKLKREAPMVSQHVQDANGLPVFFFNFRQRVKEANPGVTDDQILNAWRRQEKEAKKARR